MPTNWKYIKKLLEKEFLCEKLRGHITYDLTDYRPAPWYRQHFIMKFDDEVLLNAAQPDCKWGKRYHYPKIVHHEIHQISDKICREKNFSRFGVPNYVSIKCKGVNVFMDEKTPQGFQLHKSISRKKTPPNGNPLCAKCAISQQCTNRNDCIILKTSPIGFLANTAIN